MAEITVETQKKYTIVLSEDEAAFLRALLGRCHPDDEPGNTLWQCLQDAPTTYVVTNPSPIRVRTR